MSLTYDTKIKIIDCLAKNNFNQHMAAWESNISFIHFHYYINYFEQDDSVKDYLQQKVEIFKQYLLDNLAKNNWNIFNTSKAIGMARGSMNYYLRKLDIYDTCLANQQIYKQKQIILLQQAKELEKTENKNRSKSKLDETIDCLIKHDGSLTDCAKELGLSLSAISRRVSRNNLDKHPLLIHFFDKEKNDEYIRDMLVDALIKTDGNIKKTAEKIGYSTVFVNNKIAEFNLQFDLETMHLFNPSHQKNKRALEIKEALEQNNGSPAIAASITGFSESTIKAYAREFNFTHIIKK